MHGFTMALAQEVARKGVTVNTVSPGYIATDMVMAVREEVRSRSSRRSRPAAFPEEIAALVAFLASEDAGSSPAPTSRPMAVSTCTDRAARQESNALCFFDGRVPYNDPAKPNAFIENPRR